MPFFGFVVRVGVQAFRDFRVAQCNSCDVDIYTNKYMCTVVYIPFCFYTEKFSCHSFVEIMARISPTLLGGCMCYTSQRWAGIGVRSRHFPVLCDIHTVLRRVFSMGWLSYAKQAPACRGVELYLHRRSWPIRGVARFSLCLL